MSGIQKSLDDILKKMNNGQLPQDKKPTLPVLSKVAKELGLNLFTELSVYATLKSHKEVLKSIQLLKSSENEDSVTIKKSVLDAHILTSKLAGINLCRLGGMSPSTKEYMDASIDLMLEIASLYLTPLLAQFNIPKLRDVLESENDELLRRFFLILQLEILKMGVDLK